MKSWDEVKEHLSREHPLLSWLKRTKERTVKSWDEVKEGDLIKDCSGRFLYKIVENPHPTEDCGVLVESANGIDPGGTWCLDPGLFTKATCGDCSSSASECDDCSCEKPCEDLKQRGNRGRDTCYICGEKTQKLELMTGWTEWCPKCKT